MELAIGAFMSMFGSAAAAGAGAGMAGASAAGAAAFQAGATAATAGSTALSILQGGATALSILSTIGGGLMAHEEAKLQASADEIETRDRARRIREEELGKIGEARVAFGASGTGLGSAGQVEAGLARDAAFERELERTSGRVRQGQIKLRGRASLVSSLGSAAGTAGNYAIDLRRRG
jgi:hypothetical protein